MLALEALGYLPEVPLQEITSVGVDRANSNRRSEVTTDVTLDEAVEHRNLDRASLHSLMSRDLLKTSLRDGELVVSETELFAFERMAVNEERWSSQTQSAARDALTGFARSEPIHDRAASVLDGTTPEVLAGQVLIGRTSFWRADREQQLQIGSCIADAMMLGGIGLSVLVAKSARFEARALGLDDVSQHVNVIGVSGARRHRRALEAITLFVYGNYREHDAARTWLRSALERTRTIAAV